MQNRESDFVVDFGDRTFHIEAKRVGSLPRLMYWSDLEFAKGGELGDHYCLAALLPTPDGYDIAWIWKPADELANAERYVDWIWDGRRSEPLSGGSWQPASPPPQLPARSYTFRITLDDALLHSLPRDTNELTALKGRIAATGP